MIKVVEKEQADDEKKKVWCGDELKKAETVLTGAQEKMDNVVAALEEKKDELAGLDDDVKALETQMMELDKSVAEATEQRKKEHEEYIESTQMSEVATKLLKKAKNRLMKFYSPDQVKAPEETPESFLQVVHAHHRRNKEMPAEMPNLEGPPELKKSNSGGITALMDKIVHELAMDKQEAEFEEKTSQRDYVTLMDESKASRATLAKQIVEKKGSKSHIDKQIIELRESKKVSYEDLTNAHQYSADIHASCDFVVEHFEARTEARTKELESLHSAKQLLEAA